MTGYILGISCYYHDSAAALIKDGEILGAVQEERFTRKKHDESFPKHSIQFLLKQFKLKLSDVSEVVYYEKPFVTFERLIETHLNVAPFGFKSFLKSIPIWLKQKLFLERDIKEQLALMNFGSVPPIKYSEHHLSHASSAFFPSPFKEAAVLCIDGVGEWATTSAWIGSDNQMKPLWEIHFPHSVGLFYSTITAYLGFKVNSGEYKVMGLAPYGRPVFLEKMSKLVTLHPDGSYSLNPDYFGYQRSFQMFTHELEILFDAPARKPEGELTQFHMDIAASLQKTFEEVLIHVVTHLQRKTHLKNLCLAGGAALNCVANSKLFSNTGFQNIWIQPSAGDAGGALGAALAFYYLENKKKRIIDSEDSQKGSYLGPQFPNEEIEEYLLKNKIPFEKKNPQELIVETCQLLEAKKIIGWFQGPMEFGPRALGNRSIIGDARILDLQKTMNLKIKFRESFRPFAPIVLDEDAKEFFDFQTESPYMLFVANLNEKYREVIHSEDQEKFGIDKLNVVRSKFPAITHVDYSARLQTVSQNRNPLLYDLLKSFKHRNSSSILVNTSFNVRGEPIVCTPQDAYRCFCRTEIDVLVLGQYVIKEKVFAPDDKWRSEFELD